MINDVAVAAQSATQHKPPGRDEDMLSVDQRDAESPGRATGASRRAGGRAASLWTMKQCPAVPPGRAPPPPWDRLGRQPGDVRAEHSENREAAMKGQETRAVLALQAHIPRAKPDLPTRRTQCLA